MGYTHYWTNNGSHDPLPQSALDNIKELLQPAYKAGIIQREYDDPRPPLITAKVIRFNGVGALGHEALWFRTTDTRPLGFCKTAHKPYDDLVMKVLLILAYYRPGLRLSSDGSFGQEWLEAIDWFNRTVGRVYIQHRLRFQRPKPGPLPTASSA